MEAVIGNYVKTVDGEYGRVYAKTPTFVDNIETVGNNVYGILVHLHDKMNVLESNIEVVSTRPINGVFDNKLNNFYFGDSPVFVSSELQEMYHEFIDAAEKYQIMIEDIRLNAAEPSREFTEEEQQQIEEEVEMLIDAFEGDISESGWFFLPVSEIVVTYIKGDQGFNFMTTHIGDIF